MSDVALAIAGGGPAALSTAKAFREAGGSGRVALVTAEGTLPYDRPPLTKDFLRGESELEDLPLTDDTELLALEVERLDADAVWLDAGGHRLTLADGRDLTYATCVLATGAEPRRLDVPGSDLPGVHVVRALPHVQALLSGLRDGDEVVVVGSGFIGSEIAASLRMRGHAVTQLSTDANPQHSVLGDDVAARIATWLTDDGVELWTQSTVESIESDGDRLTVVADTGRVSAHHVVMSVGVAPRTELARSAGLAAGATGIPVDSSLRTALADVLACGDAVIAENATAGRPLRVEHWGNALEQGEIAGKVAAGQDAVWDSVPGFWSTIGAHQLKYGAWGDGYETAELTERGNGAWAARYFAGGRLVGVLAHDSDDDYEQGREQIAADAKAHAA